MWILLCVWTANTRNRPNVVIMLGHRLLLWTNSKTTLSESRRANVVLLLGHCLRRRPNIKKTLGKHPVLQAAARECNMYKHRAVYLAMVNNRDVNQLTISMCSGRDIVVRQINLETTDWTPWTAHQQTRYIEPVLVQCLVFADSPSAKHTAVTDYLKSPQLLLFGTLPSGFVLTIKEEPDSST